jgi:hypothetical protein
MQAACHELHSRVFLGCDAFCIQCGAATALLSLGAWQSRIGANIVILWYIKSHLNNILLSGPLLATKSPAAGQKEVIRERLRLSRTLTA